MNQSWDVIIVGARCAGASLAVHLARAGVKTLLLEASPRGTDLPLSTHLIQPPGVASLMRMGLGEVVRTAPESKRFRFSLDDVAMISTFEDGPGARCVRRATIDPALQNLAESSGADFRDRHRVKALVKEGERVTGVVVTTPHGQETYTANLVVGADGMNSTVAKLAGVEEYLTAEASRGGYYFYFPAPAKWENDWDAALEHLGGDVRYVFRADGDLVVLVATMPLEDMRTWGKEWRTHLLTKLAESPVTGPLSRGKEPVGKGCGILDAHYFYRRPVGPGFALLGDAGHFKDYVTGMGMTDAFLDAERLATAVLDGREEAFVHYWRDRDVATLPLHYDAIQQGTVGFNNPFMRWTIDHVSRRPELKKRVGKVIAREIQPDQMVPMSAMLPWMGEALLRGRFDVLKGFFAVGKQGASEQKELANRKALWEASRDALARAPKRERSAVAYSEAATRAALIA
jgi:flavin-dependent dehydrogenase